MADNKSREVEKVLDDNEQHGLKFIGEEGPITIKLNVDAKGAIKALKAVQREARNATQALKEHEEYVSKVLEPKESIGSWIVLHWVGPNLQTTLPMSYTDAKQFAKQKKIEIADRDHFNNTVWLFQQREEI